MAVGPRQLPHPPVYCAARAADRHSTGAQLSHRGAAVAPAGPPLPPGVPVWGPLWGAGHPRGPQWVTAGHRSMSFKARYELGIFLKDAYRSVMIWHQTQYPLATKRSGPAVAHSFVWTLCEYLMVHGWLRWYAIRSLFFPSDNAYGRTLRQYHGWVVRGVFAVGILSTLITLLR